MSECEHELEYYCTLDQLLPYGVITSTAVFKCIKCGEEFNEWEIDNDNKRKTNRILQNKNNR